MNPVPRSACMAAEFEAPGVATGAEMDQAAGSVRSCVSSADTAAVSQSIATSWVVGRIESTESRGTFSFS